MSENHTGSLVHGSTSDKVNLLEIRYTDRTFLKHRLFMLPSTINSNTSLTLEKISERTMSNIQHSVSANTKKSYQSDLRHFKTWLDDSDRVFSLPVPAGVIADYISDLDEQDFSIATIERRLNAISWMHRVNDANEVHTTDRLVSLTMQGMKRKRAEQGRKTTSQSKQPLMLEELKAVVSLIDTTELSGLRDKAMLLVGFASALRRSELVALTVEDITVTGQGADIKIRKSKTDQTGQGQSVSIMRGSPDLCPVRALVNWYESAGITGGPVFLRFTPNGCLYPAAVSGRTYADTIKKYCKLAGLNAARYSGHSSRSGMLTSAAERGCDLIPLAQHARHKTTNQTMHYIKQANRFKNNPTEGLL